MTKLQGVTTIGNESLEALSLLPTSTEAEEKELIRGADTVAGLLLLRLEPAPWWKFWHPRATSFRFFLLVLIALFALGDHFVKNGMSVIASLLLADDEFAIDNTRYGMIMSAMTVPNMIVPFWAGHLLDNKGERFVALFLLVALAGQVLMAISFSMKSFPFSLVAATLFGTGQAGVVTSQHAMVGLMFTGRELTFAVGVCMAFSNFSKIISKTTMAPVALHYGGYEAAGWYAAVICGLSLVSGWLFLAMRRRERRETARATAAAALGDKAAEQWLRDSGSSLSVETEPRLVDRDRRSPVHEEADEDEECGEVEGKSNFLSLGAAFWLLVMVHLGYENVFRLFYTVGSNFFVEKYGYKLDKAAIIASLSHVLVLFAPLVGLAIDKYGHRLHVLFLAGMLTIGAYTLLTFSSLSPVSSMLLLSLSSTFVSTIVMTLVPYSVSSSLYGLAYGIMTVFSAVGGVLGHVTIGYLRDLTGSYETGMLSLLGLAVLCSFSTLVLGVLDAKHHYGMNAGRAALVGELAAEYTEIGIDQGVKRGQSKVEREEEEGPKSAGQLVLDSLLELKAYLKRQAKGLKREVAAIYFATQDPRTRLCPKILAVVAIAYALSPIDLIPDFIPVLGYLDDLVILPCLLWLALHLIPPEVMVDAREKAKDADNLERSWAAATIFFVIWLVSGLLLLKLALKNFYDLATVNKILLTVGGIATALFICWAVWRAKNPKKKKKKKRGGVADDGKERALAREIHKLSPFLSTADKLELQQLVECTNGPEMA